MTVEGNKVIELDPAIAAVFQSSTAISTTNGRSFSMLKVGSKRRRTKSQIEADMVSGNAKAAETTMAINKLTLVIAQQEKDKQAQANEMAKQKTELLKVQQLEREGRGSRQLPLWRHHQQPRQPLVQQVMLGSRRCTVLQ
jgi:hypothetical protein